MNYVLLYSLNSFFNSCVVSIVVVFLLFPPPLSHFRHVAFCFANTSFGFGMGVQTKACMQHVCKERQGFLSLCNPQANYKSRGWSNSSDINCMFLLPCSRKYASASKPYFTCTKESLNPNGSVTVMGIRVCTLNINSQWQSDEGPLTLNIPYNFWSGSPRHFRGNMTHTVLG